MLICTDISFFYLLVDFLNYNTNQSLKWYDHFKLDLTDDECIYLTRGDQEVFKQDAIAMARHFKLTAEDLG